MALTVSHDDFTDLSLTHFHRSYWRKQGSINIFQNSNIELMYSQLSTSDLGLFSLPTPPVPSTDLQ